MPLAPAISFLLFLAFAAYVTLRLIGAEDTAAHVYAVALGVVVGGIVAALAVVHAQRFLARKDSEVAGALIGGFLFKLAGIALVGSVCWASSEYETLPFIDMATALMAYLALVFFGFAAQAKLVEGSERRRREAAVAAAGRNESAGRP